jgi:hypothetical protein
MRHDHRSSQHYRRATSRARQKAKPWKGELVEDAVRQYLEAAAITDVDPNQVADTQAKLLRELPPIPKWEADDV